MFGAGFEHTTFLGRHFISVPESQGRDVAQDNDSSQNLT